MHSLQACCHERVLCECGLWRCGLEMDRLRGRDGEKFSVILNKWRTSTFGKNETACTTRMFHNDAVFSNIQTPCEPEVSGLAQRNNFRFSSVTVRHWLLLIVPLGTCSPFPPLFRLLNVYLISLSWICHVLHTSLYLGNVLQFLFLMGDFFNPKLYRLFSLVKGTFYSI
jgi:hypothetical protein